MLTKAPAAATAMRSIPGGRFQMGSDRHYPEEAPARRMHVGPFDIDETAVTNRAFAQFVAATGYVTVAERPPDPAHYPGTPAHLLVPGSLVFRMTAGPVDLRDVRNWWAWTPGASWRHPEGPDSTLRGRKDHPVVHVAFEDAAAFADWMGKDLPTEAEWECAARGGLDGAEFAWGDELMPKGRHMANTWQGEFPWQNLATDGYPGTCPVRSFRPNGYGLFEMCGNVWEWTSDNFAVLPSSITDNTKNEKSCCAGGEGSTVNHVGSNRLVEPKTDTPQKVVKGGSFLCAPTYCRRYRPAARHAQMVDSGMSHIGFRCIRRPQ